MGNNPNKDIKLRSGNIKVFNIIGTSRFVLKTTQILIIFFILGLLMLFLPWTQNIDGLGSVTTIEPSQRPQQINTSIDGKIKKWHISEGDIVKAGDTLLQITEIKAYYLDTQLVERNREITTIKENAINSYIEKVEALKSMISILETNREVKLNQAVNKLNSTKLKFVNDSASLVANEKAFEVATVQFDRAKEMKEKGIIALYDFENRQVKFQEAKAKLTASQNKIQEAYNNIGIAKNEIDNIRNSYNEKIAKSKSDLYSSEIALLNAKNELVKQKNQLANLETRAKMYFITSPQDGFVSFTISSGIGEVVKAGQQVIKIVPLNQTLAAEMYIKPIDVPLLNKGQEVRIVFDGWPSIVFSGWPGASVGTFSGYVYSIDKNISSNGKYRVLVQQSKEHPWPDQLQVGSGLNAYALLNDVPIWFELWRQLNGFPANFYKQKEIDTNGKKK